MVAYHYDFKIALVKGSPNTVAANATVLVYDPADVTYVAPVPVYSDPALTTIVNLVTDQHGIVPDFWSAKPDLLWKSGTLDGGWATTTSRPGIRGATGDQGPQGIQGVQGNPGLNGAGTNAEVAPFISGAGPTKTAVDNTVAEHVGQASATRTALDTRYGGKVAKGELVINVLDYGAKGDWNPYTLTGTDDTAAIQAAINATPMGGTVYFPQTGSNRKYLISSQLNITTPNIRILGVPRDTYAVSVRMNVTGGDVKTMFMVKTTGVVFQDIGIEGGGGAITGVEVWGDTSGNCDSLFRGVTFMRLLVGARTRGRNNVFASGCIFSISTEGVVIDGPDAVYHTGAGANSSMWGNSVTDCRFHGCGSNVAHGNIRITPQARVLSMQIRGNEFDGTGRGSHIIATGDATYAVKNLVCEGNAHNRLGADAYVFTYVQNSTISGATASGYTTGYYSGHMFNLNNCVVLTISNSFAMQLGKSGVIARNCLFLMIGDTNFNSVGLDAAVTYNCLDIDATNTAVHLTNMLISGAPGWGFLGSPGGDSSMVDVKFSSNTLGRINSTTLHNRAVSGRNVFVEGNGGRKQDYASKSYDLTVAGGATTVATIASAATFTSFEVEVKIIGRNSGGNCYIKAIRYVRPENGAPVYTTVGTDTVAGTIAVGFTTSGTNGVNVTATATSADAFVTVHVTAVAGGGSSSAALRGVTVTMA